jgi:predicted membrane-bound spermidine synthase
LYAAFVVSGVAGLVYEVLWTRYLGLYVGHGAYAQVLVLGVYLGGMAVGSFVLADVSKRIARPILWYAVAETILALFGFVFHPVFTTVTDLSYDRIFPALASAGLVGSARWAIAGLLILPQAITLGATFPLMAASVVRADPAHPGRSVARVYLVNTLGGAAGVLLAGFWMIGALGFAGTSMAAGTLNVVAAAIAIRMSRRATASPVERVGDLDVAASPSAGETTATSTDGRPGRLLAMLLAVSFGTAVASFAYEIGWIRMLSLVLGSATHSFELMLSAFILGLALGSWWIASRSDRSTRPLALLGGIQVSMGIAAALSLPLFHAVSYDAVAWMVANLPGRPGGYALFNLSRYALCLLVMLPVTVLAGMTLPLITGTLLRAGSGERAIGGVYGVNTVGSVFGAGAAALFGLPWLGLKGLILVAAALDIALGLWLLERSSRERARFRAAGAATLLAAGVLSAVALGLRVDQVLLSSGVYRYGYAPEDRDRVGLYYVDGRTATVSANVAAPDGMISLATNGKPDASLHPRWLLERRDTIPDTPIPPGQDFTTQVLAPALALAHRPTARNVANIGHGSGLSATAFLTSESIERVVTIEIEPFMVEGSLVFMPLNSPALSDARASYVFDDAKSYFAYRRERFDIIFAEPSNPWVSGTSSLFTMEFYRRARQSLAEGGVLAQWMQIYELTDDLFLSVIAALDAAFPSYRAYLVGDMDVAIVASADGPVPEPDWSIFASRGFRDLTESAPEFRRENMDALFLFDETTFRALLDRGVRPNSDYRPVLDLGAERARFEQERALGTYSFGVSRVDLARLLKDERVAPVDYYPAPSYGLEPALLWARAAWLREAKAAGGGIAPEAYPEFQNALSELGSFLALVRASAVTTPWDSWSATFDRVESSLHWGTIGWVDTTFYREVDEFLERAGAPEPARAAVELKRGLSLLQWDRVATSADMLAPRVAFGERWVDPGTLLDAAVVAHLRTGRPAAARQALDMLRPRTGRAPGNLRDRLLDAMVSEAEREAPN